MLIRRKLKSPVIAVPAGMSMVLGGLLLIMLSIALPHFAHSLPPRLRDNSDFIRGFLIGFGIVMEIAGLVTMLPAAWHKDDPSTAPRD